jgi:hypothetical protein
MIPAAGAQCHGADRERRGPGDHQVLLLGPVEDRRKTSFHGPGRCSTMARRRPRQCAQGQLPARQSRPGRPPPCQVLSSRPTQPESRRNRLLQQIRSGNQPSDVKNPSRPATIPHICAIIEYRSMQHRPLPSEPCQLAAEDRPLSYTPSHSGMQLCPSRTARSWPLANTPDIVSQKNVSSGSVRSFIAQHCQDRTVLL